MRCPCVCLSRRALERRGIGPKRPLSGLPAPIPQGSRLRFAFGRWGQRAGVFRVAQVLRKKGPVFLFPGLARPAPQRRPARRGRGPSFYSYSDTKFCLSNRQEARSARKHCAGRYQIRKNLWITFPHSGVWGCKKTSPGAGFLWPETTRPRSLWRWMRRRGRCCGC